MAKIAHISDLHFGRIRRETIEPLCVALRSIAPDLIAVSGDLTQRATKAQFAAARDFLRELVEAPQIVVPGNHDIPLYNLWRRFIRPRKRFDRFITSERHPRWSSGEAIVVGVDTARSWALSNGRINRKQIRKLHDHFASAPDRALRIVVAHHPFVLPDELPAKDRVGRADMALADFVETEVDLLLTGHRHVPWVSPLSNSIPTIHAGTTTSSRTRGVGNSFNEIVVSRRRVVVHRHDYVRSRRAYVSDAPTAIFPRDDSGRLARSSAGNSAASRRQDSEYCDHA